MPPDTARPCPSRAPRRAPGARLRALPTSVLFAALAAVLAALAGAALLYAAAEPSGASEAAAARPALAVTLAAPRTVRWEESVAAEGTIEPWQEMVIGARTGGLPLAEVRVEVGATVRRGELLARFDAALPRAEAAQLEAALAQAGAAARNALAVRERMTALSASGAVSRQDVQQAETQAETAQAQVRLVAAQLDAKHQLLRYADVLAPDDGVVSARAATPGSVANAGQELFRIIRRQRLEWRAELAPAQLGGVRAGQEVALELPGGGAARAIVRRSAPRLDAQTRLATVFADIVPEAGAAGPRAGMYAAGRILLGASDALVVPAHSVVVRDGRSWVFVAEGSGPRTALVRAVPVRVGRRQGADSEILSGLPASQRVVGQGAAFLKDGDEVQVVAGARR